VSTCRLEPSSRFLVLANLRGPHSSRKFQLANKNRNYSIEATDMRMKSIVFFVAALALGIVAPGAAASAEEYRGTMDEQMACTPDVWRLCSDQIPDVNRIVACLRQNTPQLSDGCRAVFDTSNRVDQPAPSRGRRPPPPAAMPVQPLPRSDDWFRQQ
jgi:hypothetical protein